MHDSCKELLPNFRGRSAGDADSRPLVTHEQAHSVWLFVKESLRREGKPHTDFLCAFPVLKFTLDLQPNLQHRI